MPLTPRRTGSLTARAGCFMFRTSHGALKPLLKQYGWLTADSERGPGALRPALKNFLKKAKNPARFSPPETLYRQRGHSWVKILKNNVSFPRHLRYVDGNNLRARQWRRTGRGRFRWEQNPQKGVSPMY